MIHKDPTGTNGAWNGSLWNAITRNRQGWYKRIMLQDESKLTLETVKAVQSLVMRLANVTRQDAIPSLINQIVSQFCGSLTALIQGAGLAGIRFLGEVAYTYGVEGRPLGEWFRSVDMFTWRSSKKARHKENNGKEFPNVGISLVGDSTFQFYGENGKAHRLWKTLLSNELHY